ncbi:MAG: hypothetical protein HWN80_01535 [Candidatus Lokiarchaeota archaeon]|nr:hypothetical protein [Candidatus Lokiarchaeota archaeon]
MKSNKNGSSEEKIEKVTESLWKIWWFSFYLIIVPSLVAVVGFFIFFFIGKDIYVSIGLSVITFMFVLLFFYKAFDKYRNNPFFLNRKNNLSARINILFLITVLALIVTPIFVINEIFTPGEDNYFELLPLISFIILYNIVYYYYFFQPIDVFDFSEERYKHEVPFSQWIKQPYNLIIIVNYIIHIIFLSYTFNTKVSWLFPLISNLVFYLISRLTTMKNIKNLSKSTKNSKEFLMELTKYKRKFVNSILSLNFALLIQMPFAITLIYIFMGIQHEIIEIISISILSLIFLLFYFKIRLYISSFYSKILRRFEIDEFE